MAQSPRQPLHRLFPRCFSFAILAAMTLLAGRALAAEAPAAATPEAIEFFEKQVRPLLVERCITCHGEKEQGGLRLDSQAAMLKGSDSGAVINAADPAASLLVKAVHWRDEPKMPPDNKLPDEAIATIETWVKMGTPWPASDAAPLPAAKDTSKTRAEHWSFQPIRKPALPQVRDTIWPRSDIDYFILSVLEQNGLTPAPAADRRTLLRRASFDVTGLPPTAAEVERFVADPDPLAINHEVERLLASPTYGERWARHWLDVARYADTKGYVFTEDRKYPNAFRYRDWVVQALNADLPYDDFLIQQIAGDRLPQSDDKSSLAAMGFLTVGRRFLNNPHDIIDDRLDVLTRGTMALTVTCARCHDHKYDPIPTKDYYSLYGVMASTVEPKEPADYMTLADAENPVNPHVFVRGNSGNPGEQVPRRFLSIIAGPEAQPFQQGSGRLELAQAIANGNNPLTARVIVNRVWMYYFDNPLVRTPSDFGLRSQKPSHPELLDYLAATLIESDWSLKQLQRMILTSAAYQQSSADRPVCRAVDPENRLVWHMNRKRLDFEALRDSLLAVSGQLNRSLGGPAVELTSAPWATRRTLYGMIDRQNLPNLFRTFDFASPDTHSPQRFTTTVPQQALYMMNSPFVRDQAQQLAARPEFAGLTEPGAKVERLYEVALARKPTAGELQLGLAFFAAEKSASPKSTEPATDAQAAAPPAAPVNLSPWERYVQVVLLSNEFVFVD